MLDLSKMSKAELHFVRVYVDALRRDFDLLTTVFAVAHPDNLAIKDITVSARVARGLQELNHNFDKRLAELSPGKNAKKLAAPFGPSLEVLAQFFALSFFKLLHVHKENNVTKNTSDHGWYSGKPEDWKVSLALLTALEAEQPVIKHLPQETVTSLFAILKSFFGGINFVAHTTESESDEKNKANKVWPVAEAATDWLDWDDYEDDETEEDDLWGGWFL